MTSATKQAQSMVGVSTESKELNYTEVGYVQPDANPTYQYFQREEKLAGFLSQQFPTIANPAPLGLCAFALTTFVLSMYNAGIIIAEDAPQGIVMGLALFYGGLIQLLAGMWEFRTGNTFGATVFSSYGGFWMSFAALFTNCFGFLDPYTNAGDLHNGLGIYLLSWSIFSLLATIGAHRGTLALVFLLWTVHMTFMMLSIGQFLQGDLRWQRAGGSFGIVAALTAWYCAMGTLLTPNNSLFTLPLFPMDDIWKKFGYLKVIEQKQIQ